MAHSAYIIQQKNNLIYSFYYSDGSIYMRHFHNNIWSRGENLVSDIRKNYSISQNANQLYLICQEIKGNLLLYTYKDNTWTRKILLEATSPHSPDIYMHSIITNNGLQLIYNLPEGKSKTQNLVLHHQLNNGQWTPPKILDNITPNTTFFRLINNKYLFYIKNNSLYFQNITLPDTITKLYTGNILDYSAIYLNNNPYISLIVKNKVGIQLIYINNRETRVLWEGGKASLTAINYINNQIIIHILINNRLYSITNPDKSKELSIIGADNYKKAQYITQNNSFSDIIINGNRPNNLYFIDTPKKEPVDNRVNMLQQDIEAITKELNQKNSTINQLYNYKARNQELIQENTKLRQRYKELLDKYKALENQKQLPALINKT